MLFALASALRASGRPLADRFARIDADSPFANGLLFDVFDRKSRWFE
jgi:hypothetical protein